LFQGASVVAVILARKGSKGVPGKNVRTLLGRPVLSYTIDHVRESHLLDTVVCSTDDPEVVKVCQSLSVEVISRPEELAQDQSGIEGALLHTLESLREGGRSFDYCLVLYGCVPVRSPGLLDRCIRQIVEGGKDCLVTLAKVGKANPHWMFQRQGDSFAQFMESSCNQRQGLPDFFLVSGSALVFRSKCLSASRSRSRTHLYSSFGETMDFLTEAWEDTVDVDTERDLLIAEAVLKKRGEKERSS
jgi:CMP-N-acetylneuraminic acid synthetase